jgi:hypothetical protein
MIKKIIFVCALCFGFSMASFADTNTNMQNQNMKKTGVVGQPRQNAPGTAATAARTQPVKPVIKRGGSVLNIQPGMNTF